MAPRCSELGKVKADNYLGIGVPLEGWVFVCEEYPAFLFITHDGQLLPTSFLSMASSGSGKAEIHK